MTKRGELNRKSDYFKAMMKDYQTPPSLRTSDCMFNRPKNVKWKDMVEISKVSDFENPFEKPRRALTPPKTSPKKLIEPDEEVKATPEKDLTLSDFRKLVKCAIESGKVNATPTL